MLSKLFHINVPDSLNQAHFNTAVKKLELDLRDSYQKVNLISCKPGGTLGVFFYAEINGQERFIKTHLHGTQYRNNIVKEFEIMRTLYGDCLHIERRDVELGDGNDHAYTFLVMNKLSVLKQNPDIMEIRGMISKYQDKLEFHQNNIGAIDGLYTYTQLYENGLVATEKLLQLGLITPKVANICLHYLNCLERNTEFELEEVLCHGDLSNKNIMLLEDKPIVIDWEDSFVGNKNYDFCYWLTFFDQRRYYNDKLLNLFSRLYGDSKQMMAQMVLITVLKCYLSYLNGSFKTNSVTFDARLEELFAIDNEGGL